MHDIQVEADNRDIRDERAEIEDHIEHMTTEEFGAWLADYDRRWFCDDVAEFAQIEVAWELANELPF